MLDAMLGDEWIDVAAPQEDRAARQRASPVALQAIRADQPAAEPGQPSVALRAAGGIFQGQARALRKPQEDDSLRRQASPGEVREDAGDKDQAR